MRVKTNLVRAKDLNFVCVASPAAVNGGGMGDAIIGKGGTMSSAFESCKRKCAKGKDGESKVDTFLVYASVADDIEVDKAGHVKASSPVLRLTKLNRLGRVSGK